MNSAIAKRRRSSAQVVPTVAMDMNSTEPYAAEYIEGRRAGLAGAERDTNPYFSRSDDDASHSESAEVWRSKYDVWRQGWISGNLMFTERPPDR